MISRVLPATLTARLFIALCGSMLVALVVGAAVFLYDYRLQSVRWAAVGWSVKVNDLVRIFDTMDAPQRANTLRALARAEDSTAHAADTQALPTSAADPEFLSSFRRGAQALRRTAGTVSISTSQTGVTPDLRLDILPDLQPASRTTYYDVRIPYQDGPPVVLRLRVVQRTVLIKSEPPYHLLAFPVALLVAQIMGTWVLSQGVTVPLARLSEAADAIGRGRPQEPLVEQGPRELRRAAHAFNSMQDRLRRYLDSRTRVVAAMSHDLRTPITRMVLRVEAVTDPVLQTQLSHDLDEMQQMVQEALHMLHGLQSDELVQPINIDVLLVALRDDYQALGFPVTVVGSVVDPFLGRPQAWRRLLTNLLDNCRKYASKALLEVEQQQLNVVFRIQDDGPGIPDQVLERVFEPYYRIDPSRSRTTGGVGLGLSIARDIAQAHGGDLSLRNLPGGGLEALVRIPRRH